MDAFAASMEAQRLGAADTRAALAGWRGDGLRAVAPWAAGSCLLGLGLLAAALLVARSAGPSGAEFVPVFADPAAGAAEALEIFRRNLLVLLLYCLVALAAYLGTRSLPRHADGARGLSRAVHAHAGPAAVGIAGALALYSLGWQAWILGHDLADAAATLGLSPAGLLLRLSVHAVPELTALFLPLAATLALARARRPEALAGAALLSGAIAVPIVAVMACVEVWLTPLFVI